MKKLLLLIPLFICACNVQRRQLDKLDEYAVKYPVEMQGLANRLYPCFSGKAKSDTVITKEKPDTTITFSLGNLQAMTDSLWKTLPDSIKNNTKWAVQNNPNFSFDKMPNWPTSGVLGTMNVPNMPIKIVTIKIPTQITIHDTVTNDRALAYKDVQNKIKADSLIIVKTQQASTKHTLNIWRLIAIGLISLLAIYFIAKVVIFFYGGGWANTIKKVI